MIKEYCSLDLETTGNLERTKPTRITSIGIVKFKVDSSKYEYVITDKCYSLINPEEPLDDFIIKFIGLTDDRLKDAPKFADVANSIVDFIGDLPIVAWPINFDIPILQYEYALAGYKNFPLDRRAIDIGTIARYFMWLNTIPLLGEKYDFSTVLKSLNHIFQISMQKTHNSREDAEVQGRLLGCILQQDLIR